MKQQLNMLSQRLLGFRKDPMKILFCCKLFLLYICLFAYEKLRLLLLKNCLFLILNSMRFAPYLLAVNFLIYCSFCCHRYGQPFQEHKNYS